jgi:glycosyltransferase involved in cell wall biosynthesis
MKTNILYLHAGSEMYGADKILLEILKGIDLSKFRPYVVLPNDGPLLLEIKNLGIDVDVFELGVLRRKYFNVLGFLNRLFYFVIASIRISTICRNKNIHIIHSNTSVVLVGGVIAKLANKPHVWHIHEITTSPKFVRKVLANIIPRLSTQVVAVSNAVKYHLISGCKLNSDKTIVIYNGITINSYFKTDVNKIKYEFGLTKNNVIVGMVGRINRWKGQTKFLDVAKIIKSYNLNAKFFIVGDTFDGEEYLLGDLRKKIRELDLEKDVILTGFRNDIPNFLATFDVLLLPSIEPDPFPTVVLEAMASSKPVVSFAHGGAVEMIEDGVTGYVVPPLDVQLMADSAMRILNDIQTGLIMGINARKRSELLFSNASFITKINNLYTTLSNVENK